MDIGGAVVACAETWKGQARSATGVQSSLLRRHTVDFANRGGLAFLAGGVSLALHVLATAAEPPFSLEQSYRPGTLRPIAAGLVGPKPPTAFARPLTKLLPLPTAE